MTVLARPEVVLGGDDGPLQQALSRAGSAMESAGKRMQRIGNDLSRRVTLRLTLAGGAALHMAGNFQSSMNRVQALTGATTREFASMSEQAKELGATTQFSASQAADAMGFLAMAGFEANQITAAMPSTLQLAAAAQIDLARAADITSNILTGYGLEVAELGRANDVLVKTFTSSNVNLEMLGEALKNVGPIASSVGIEFEEVAAALGRLGDAGIQGGEAGTALRIGIGRLLNPTKMTRDALDGLGIAMDQVDPRTRSLADIIDTLSASGADAGDILQIFGQRGAALAALVAQGGGAVRELTEELRDAGGTAQRVADVQMAGFQGALRELRSAIEAAGIALMESGMIVWAEDLARRVSALFRELATVDPAILKIVTVVGLLAAATGPLVVGLGILTASVGSVVTALMALNVVLASGGIAAMIAGGGIIAAVAALAGGAAFLITKLRGVNAELDKTSNHVSTTALNVQLLAGLNREAFDELPDDLKALAGGLRETADASNEAAEGARAHSPTIEELGARIKDVTVGAINPMTGALLTLDERIQQSFDTSRAERWAETIERARIIIEQTRTPLERYTATIRELDDLLAQGAISQDVYARAAANAASALNEQADAQDRLNSSLSKGSRLLGALGGLGRVAGFAIPGLGQVSGLLSAAQGFAGFFADGGTIPRGQWGIVGERGPEIVQGPANVTPISDGGGAVSITFVANDGRQISDTITYRQKRGERLNRVIKLPIQVATG